MSSLDIDSAVNDCYGPSMASKRYAHCSGPGKLREWATKQRTYQYAKDLASAMGTDPQTWSRILSGSRRPTFEVLVAIERMTRGKILATDWEVRR